MHGDYMKEIETNRAVLLEQFKDLFRDNNSVLYRTINSKNGKFKGELIFLDGMVSTKVINESVIPQLTNTVMALSPAQLIETALFACEVRLVMTYEDAVYAVLAGDTILLIDGYAEIVVIDTKGFVSRGISEPSGEQVLRGPKEGFNEVLMHNITMIRRRLQNPNLKLLTSYMATTAHTQIALCYIEGIADPALIADFQERLKATHIEECFDTNTIQERIKDHPYSMFKTMGMSERVDVVVSKLCEGRVALIVDGSPTVLTAPYIFAENFHAPDDYYLHFYYASLSRILRFFGFLLACALPAIYLAVITYHKQMLPFSLLMSVISSRSGVPFPSILEATILILCFELLREATLRGPNQLGQTLSVVSAIVFGDAAINAKLISAPMLIVVAFSALCGIMNPRLKSAILVLRFFYLWVAFAFGLLGVFLLTMLLLTHLYAMKTFAVPYMSRIKSEKGWDHLLRVPNFLLKRVGGKQ